MINSHTIDTSNVVLLPEIFKQYFGFPKIVLHGQFAMVSLNKPFIRTIRLFGIEGSDELVFFSHTQTGKWQHLIDNPNVSICFSTSDKVQIIIKARAVVQTYDVDKNVAVYYKTLPPSLKCIYGTPLTGEVPENFGVVRCRVEQWELLQLEKDYLKSTRHQFSRQGNENCIGWKKELLAVVS